MAIRKEDASAQGENDMLFETIAVYNELGRTYTDRIAGVDLPALDIFAALLPEGGRILDVGCAAGRDSAKFANRGFEVHGIDLSSVFVDIARNDVDNASFYVMDARAIPFAPEQFDGIWAHAVLLNLTREEVSGVLGEFFRVLKTGGICLVAVKIGEGERLIGEELVNGLKRRETYFMQEELETLFLQSGFHVLTSGVVGDDLGRSKTKWLYIFAEKVSAEISMKEEA